MNAPAPSVERLREAFSLEADGSLRWKIRPSNRVKVGHIAGTVGQNGYIYIRLDDSLQLGHRMVWAIAHGEWPSQSIDHINCNRADNRIENLRLADFTQQFANVKRKRNNTSGFKGVSVDKRSGKFIAQIHRHGKHYHLGLFTSAEEAHRRYVAVAKAMFGEFARAA